MSRVYGRCLKGQRLRASIPHGHWRTTTFVGALRHDRLVAPRVFDGPIDGDIFLAYVEEILAPTLASGDIMVMDNLSSHKVFGVMEAIEDRGTQVIFLPPYSPDFSPIEQVFSKLKVWLRKAAKERSLSCAMLSARPSNSSLLKNASTTSLIQATVIL